MQDVHVARPPSFDSPLSSLLSFFGSVFSQNARLLRLRFATDSRIAPDLLLPHRLQGTKALSTCYRYELEYLSADTHIELKDLLGQPVEIGLLLAEDGERVMADVVTQAKQLGGDGGFARYGLFVEPAMATLVHRMNSRVFQDKSISDIVTAVLEEHGTANPVFARSFTLDNRLSGITRRARTACNTAKAISYSSPACSPRKAFPGASHSMVPRTKRRITRWCCSTTAAAWMRTAGRLFGSIALRIDNRYVVATSRIRPARYHAEHIAGENSDWADERNGVYYYVDLVVLKTATIPAVLLEADIIVNRDEEMLLQEPGTRKSIAEAVTQGLRTCGVLD